MRTPLLLVLVALILAGCGGRSEVAPKLSPAARNRLAGERWLEENARRPGVRVTSSGLQYRVVREGKGRSPAPTDTALVHYDGKLIDGKVFDTTHDPNSRHGDRPARLALAGAIRGFREGLQLMREGAIYEFAIPSNLAYGLERAPETIGPNQVLLFTVELIEVTAGGRELR